MFSCYLKINKYILKLNNYYILFTNLYLFFITIITIFKQTNNIIYTCFKLFINFKIIKKNHSVLEMYLA